MFYIATGCSHNDRARDLPSLTPWEPVPLFIVHNFLEPLFVYGDLTDTKSAISHGNSVPRGSFSAAGGVGQGQL